MEYDKFVCYVNDDMWKVECYIFLIWVLNFNIILIYLNENNDDNLY